MTSNKELVDKAILDFEYAVGNYQRSFGSSYSVIDGYKAKRNDAYNALKDAIKSMGDAVAGTSTCESGEMTSPSPATPPDEKAMRTAFDATEKEYQQFRWFLLRYGNIHPDDKSDVARLVYRFPGSVRCKADTMAMLIERFREVIFEMQKDMRSVMRILECIQIGTIPDPKISIPMTVRKEFMAIEEIAGKGISLLAKWERKPDEN